MAITAPTVDEFKARFPKLANEPNIQDNIDEAARMVDDSWDAADVKPAILFLAAHYIVSEKGAVDRPANVTSEQISTSSVSFSYGDASSASALRSTEYGRRYLTLLRMNRGGPLLVGGCA
jgi:hypothetical protein